MTVTVDLINRDSINILRELEKFNIIRVYPSEADSSEITRQEADYGDAVNEMRCIREAAQAAAVYPPSGRIEDALKELAQRADSDTKRREYLSMLQRLPQIITILSGDDAVKQVRAMRDEWDRG